MPDLQPFRIQIADEVIDDLRERLRRTRWPPTLHGGGWTLGTDPVYLSGGVANRIAVQFAERLLGLHVTQPRVVGEPGEAPLTDAERAMLAESDRWEKEDAAYSYMQETRPATLAHALTDSPAGLAAWIVEKLHEWTDPAVKAADLLAAEIRAAAKSFAPAERRAQ